ncbi:MAG: hypothetical protein D6681_16535 [Calditrichaeota bacterium]|nr:MAG: hypothetical protein D6681_16535 [Calditrichota bacterium]
MNSLFPLLNHHGASSFTRYWILDTGYWFLDTGFWLLDTGFWILALASPVFVFGIGNQCRSLFPVERYTLK